MGNTNCDVRNSALPAAANNVPHQAHNNLFRKLKKKKKTTINSGVCLYDNYLHNFPELEAGDVILEVNDKEVVALTTKEVLKCLRLSSDIVNLKLKK
uniref:PDZ domain-containing protein n=1 Tax=Strigamia maritima TaxID=126957 RepID=T1JM04_STRMM